MENSMEVPQKTKNRATKWPSNPTPGHISREKHNLKRYRHPNIYCSTIYNSQDMETTYMFNKAVGKEDVVHTCSGILLSRLCNPIDYSPPGSMEFSRNSPGKNTGVGCHSLLQGNLPDPGIELRSPAMQVDFLPSEPLGKPHLMLSTLEK